jgi:hypothetical protein
MIEFKGTYYKTNSTTAQTVLIQFDGVLLHVWHLSDPFHRIFASDVFRVPYSLARHRPFIKLPNGGKIESDDTKSLIQLRTTSRSLLVHDGAEALSRRSVLLWFFGTVTAFTLFLIAYWLHAF